MEITRNPNKDKESATATRAKPIRAALQKLLKDRIKTRDDQKRLADFLGQSVASVQAMLYRGEGGMDSWISALIYTYKLDPKTLERFLAHWRETLRRAHPLSDSDQGWFELDSLLNEEQKFYWLSLIRASLRIQADLAKKKRRG